MHMWAGLLQTRRTELLAASGAPYVDGLARESIGDVDVKLAATLAFLLSGADFQPVRAKLMLDMFRNACRFFGSRSWTMAPSFGRFRFRNQLETLGFSKR